MRVSDGMTFTQVNRNLEKNRTEMSDLQNKAATQKRVNKPSDDPVAAARVLTTRIDLQGSKQYIKNLNYAQSFLEFTDQSLDELTQTLVRLKELIVGQSNDASANKTSRRVVATEVEQLYNQMVKVGNRKLGDRFIFGGFSTTKAPFATKGQYKGDSGEILVSVDKQSYLAMNIPGSKVFLGEGLSADGISHATSTQPATIEDFVAENDQKDLKEKPQEPVKASPTLRGPASVESSLNQHAIANTPSKPAKTESDQKGTNLFNMVKKIEIALRTDDKVGLQNSLEKVDSAISQVVLARSHIGSRAMVLNSSLETLQKGKVDAYAQISNLEDADAFKVISDINKSESTLQATLATSGKMMQKSLMDFLR